MNLDFLEIGTSTYDTLIETATDTTVGISVEPVKCNLDLLPNKANVIKVNAAITSYRTTDTVDVFYIPPEDIPDEYYWVRGCNRIGEPHPVMHVGDKAKQLLRKDTVKLMNIGELLDAYNVKSIKFLKIDTEGYDCVILMGLFDYLKFRNSSEFPRKIHFETNGLTHKNTVDLTIARALRMGYKLIGRDGYNTDLEYVGGKTRFVPELRNGRLRLI